MENDEGKRLLAVKWMLVYERGEALSDRFDKNIKRSLSITENLVIHTTRSVKM